MWTSLLPLPREGGMGWLWPLPRLAEMKPRPSATVSGDRAKALREGSQAKNLTEAVFCWMGQLIFLFITGMCFYNWDTLQSGKHLLSKISKYYRKMNILLFVIPNKIWFSSHSIWVLFWWASLVNPIVMSVFLTDADFVLMYLVCSPWLFFFPWIKINQSDLELDNIALVSDSCCMEGSLDNWG